MCNRHEDSKRGDRVLPEKGKWKEERGQYERVEGHGNDICSPVVADLNNGPA